MSQFKTYLCFFFQCLIDAKWFREDDKCAKNPIDCPDGFTVSIWEKTTFDPLLLAETDPEEMPAKYLVSSGAHFDRETATAIPGLLIYRKVSAYILITYLLSFCFIRN